MLTIKTPKIELFNDDTSEFISVNETILYLEHSLISISKWEAKWHRSFLASKELNYEETIDYIRCMTLNKNVNENVYNAITSQHIKMIDQYLSNPMTATCFLENKNNPSKGTGKDKITSELIYYWMISLGIPSEYQKWHLNRLLTLIKVCSIKNTPSTKRNTRDIMKQTSALNQARKQRLHTNG